MKARNSSRTATCAARLRTKAATSQRLKGGFPFAYLFDSPGVSVERHLSFGEDALHPTPLVLDIAIYWAAIMFAFWFATRQSESVKYSANM